MSAPKDFFISYNSADKQMAEWIAWQLEDAGYTTVIQAWDFGFGQNFVLAMHKAASDAKRTIALLSPNYLEAEYTAPEWAAAFVQDPKGEQQKLVPIRVKPVETNGLLTSIVYIDLFNTDEYEAKDRLINGIKSIGKRQKPQIAPIFPGKKAPDFPIYSATIIPTQNYVSSNSVKTFLKAKPEYRAAQVDRIPQAIHFQEVISKECMANNGKTWGFVVCGPNHEWPTGLRFKLFHLLSSELIDDDSFSPIIFPLRTEKSKSNKSAQEWLWGLFKENFKLTAKSIDLSELEKTLETDGSCYVFVRELSSDEASNALFIAEMLAMWDSIKLGANSKSQFLLLIHETQNPQPSTKKWWGFAKKEISWEDDLRKALEAKMLKTSAILPPLQPPEWKHISDWLKAHFVDDQESLRDEIVTTLQQAFPNVDSIPHRELKNRLIKYFQSNQT